MIGLGILVAAVLMAIAAPLLADEAGLRAINTTHNPTFASPSEFAPLGTDSLGRDVLTQFVWGARTSSPVFPLRRSSRSRSGRSPSGSPPASMAASSAAF